MQRAAAGLDMKLQPREARKPCRTKGFSPPTRTAPIIHILSDSTGNLARHMLAALVTQFPPASISTQFHPFITSTERLDQVLDSIKDDPGAICHAVVSQPFKQRIAAYCQEAGLVHHDLTGGVIDFLSQATGISPRSDLASLHRIDASYKRRIGALEFTLSHDDGLGLATLDQADIVLAGVSRTGKTPTSIYLAQQGYRVANVALAFEVEPPRELLSISRGKGVGLMINPQQLVLIRARREAGWRMEQTSYADPAHIERELAWVRRLFVRQGWPVLDVTDQAVEETAAKIVEVLGLSEGPSEGEPWTELA